MKNALGFCGRIKIEAFRRNDSLIGYAQSVPFCPSSNSRAFGEGDPMLAEIPQASLHKVRVSALIQFYPGGSWISQAYADVFPYE
ncbi:hypothetical protein GCM10009681_25420 [Luedemannella helvata]|uniref:Uncharacterized protein n=2 Tax=Luedemannella helvata TaxID=349315 RepID=A0ABP4WJ40_9ACTN